MLKLSTCLGYLLTELSRKERLAAARRDGFSCRTREEVGFAGAIGTEYKPVASTEAGLAWKSHYQ